jgi:hypothetical protein
MPVIPATWEVDIRRIVVRDQPGQKVSNSHISNKQAGCVSNVYNPSYEEGCGRKITVQGRTQAKSEILSEK